jgi:hypothetical protein
MALKLVALLMAGIFWCFGQLDELAFRRKLHLTVPHLKELLRELQGMLADEPLTIGPRRRYFSAIPLTALYWLLGTFAVLFLWVGAAWVVIWCQANPFIILGPPALCLVVLAGCGSAGLALWQGHGGRMLLSGRGVELRYRRTTVLCPWALFTADGEPCRTPGGKAVWLPVAAKAVPMIEVCRRGRVAPYETSIETSQLRVVGEAAVLYDHYKVDPLELAHLLLKLGRAIASMQHKNRMGPLGPHSLNP